MVAKRQKTSTPLRVLIAEDSGDDALPVVRELKRGGYEPAHERVHTPAGVEDVARGGIGGAFHSRLG